MRIFGWPVLLATLSAAGLVLALLGDGLWDVLSWILLAAPIAAILWGILRARSRVAAQS
jgi:hypothetical protein